MSLTSSLFTGTSGMTNMGNAMQVIGDNVANVNTVGFKGNRYTFADLLSQSVATQSGSAQVGRGMALGSVDSSFGQGSFESTGNTTDLSIGGDGFFVLRQAGTEREFYTRAGNFNFDKEGYLVNPEGYIVQGWKLDSDTGEDVGAVTDILLESFTSPPRETDHVRVVTNLNADKASKTSVMSNVWDATEDTQITPSNYEYQTVVKVYDSLGSTHDITVYYDKKDGAKWEYMIACNPTEDQRSLVQDTIAQGILARGVITFSDSSGTVSNITMERMTGLIGNIETGGSLNKDKTHFTINNYDVFKQDYYNIGLEFDGTNWRFNNYFGRLDPPYDNATITGDANSIKINFDNDTAGVTDLTINFDEPAQPFDSVSFNLNDPNRLHIQGVNNTLYTGDTANDNTTLFIHNPEVLTDNAANNTIVWNAAGTVPFWSWGNIHTMDTFTGSVTAANTTFAVSNTANLVDTTAPFTLQYNAGAWSIAAPAIPPPYTAAVVTGDNTYVNVALTNASGGTTNLTYTFNTPLGAAAGSFNVSTSKEVRPVGYLQDSLSHTTLNNITTADFTYTVTNPQALVNGGPFGVAFNSVAGTWAFDPAADPAAAGSPYAAPPAGTTIVAAGSNATNLTIDLRNATTGQVSRILYTFDPPLTTNVDFDFSTTAYVQDAYAFAEISGDRDKVYLDMNNDGNNDIEFRFENPLTTGAGATNSTIKFDLEGSTAWEAQTTNDNGYYEFLTDFLGADGGVTESPIEFNIGAKDDGTGRFVNDSLSTTQYARSSTTTFQNANGYGAGDLQGVDVATDGVMTGIYSNGELIPLYRVALAKFLNNQGLFKEGGNLYRETRDSGSPITNKPGTNGLGSLSPNSLEMSNVDMSTEFVKMIVTQRGFQANSKIVTTVDTLLGEVINMKR